MERLDSFWGENVNAPIASVFFAPIPIGFGHTVKLTVLLLILGAVFFTLRMGFINIRAFGHAIAVTRGKYDNPDDQGEVSHFQALTAALSATVGLGNIAGSLVGFGGFGDGLPAVCAEFSVVRILAATVPAERSPDRCGHQ